MPKIKKLEEIWIEGRAISSGIAIGTPFFLKKNIDLLPDTQIELDQVDAEVNRLRDALESTRHDLTDICKHLDSEKLLEGFLILQSQIEFLSDPLLAKEAEQRILSKRKRAESILQELLYEYQQKFEEMEDSFFKERFQDVKDVVKRLIQRLLQKTKTSLPDLPENTILFTEDISPLETAEAIQKKVKAIVSEKGSATAHAAILARAKEIPYMTNISFSSISEHLNGLVIVDGKNGKIIFNPSQDTINTYEKMHSDLIERRESIRQQSSLKIETYDGYEMRLMANIESIEEISAVHHFGGNGVGLYRSENMLVGRNSLPSEDEQLEIYRALLENMKGKPATVRTFDVGRDKAGINPVSGHSFLGFRAIGNIKREREIFMTQIRALYRASAYGDLNILFPMVSSLQELLEAKQMVKEAAIQLKTRRKIRIGCMIEVPSAAIISDLLARECDFLSIGTNDLIQYTLAVDRCDHLLSHLYQPSHPCVIRLIQHVVTEANRHNIPVSICGEMAANPKFTSLLMGLGVRELSVAARYVPLIRESIRSSSILSCFNLAEKVLSISSAYEIQSLLDDNFQNHFARDHLEQLL